jgi:phage shock protein PspC (stress-responsive transcriptional regulator)
MTATDSSHLEPDTRSSATASAPDATAVDDSPNPPPGIEPPQPAAALPPANEGLGDPDPAGADGRPRATRVAEGAWLGGVCTGLARHLGWPLIAVRIAFVALATFQFIGVLTYGATAGVDRQGSWIGVREPGR